MAVLWAELCPQRERVEFYPQDLSCDPIRTWAFKEMIKVKCGHWGALTPEDWGFCKRRRSGHRHAHLDLLLPVSKMGDRNFLFFQPPVCVTL